VTPSLRIIPVTGLGEIGRDAPLGPMVADAADAQGDPLETGDCVVVTQKIVSKAEGWIVPLDHDDLEARAAIIEQESVRILRRRDQLVIAETRHGFVCANAGVDLSNVDAGFAALLPADGDRSAHRIRDAIRATTGVTVAVIVSDTFGRPWRLGLTDVAIGVAGIAAVVDLRGDTDDRGQTLRVTEVAIADEIAAAAELVMGKSRGFPAAVVRGLEPGWFGTGSVRDLVRPPAEDLFR
jgi:coenzyme F420-0:L-glutamate ligase/coenzyme F420-1:gamma-L-glutamate ligase